MVHRLLIIGLTLFLGSLMPSAVDAQSCQYSPYWGQQGELWDPNGPLKDYSHVGYHGGDDPVPYQQRAASLTFGPGRYTVTAPIILTHGVLRGAGVDQTTLYFPKGLVGMGYPCPGKNCWEWERGVIQLGPGSEIGLEDLAIEFAPHKWSHHNGQGYNGPTLEQCVNCWIKNVKVINADEGFGLRRGHHNTIDTVEIIGGYHNYIHMTLTQHNLVTNFRASGGSYHGFSGNWDTHGGVYSNGWGNPVVINPDHNGPTTTGLLYSNIQGSGGKKTSMSDTFLWNYMNQSLCPQDIHQAQLAKRHGEPPPPEPDGCRFSNLARCATASASSVWSSSYTAAQANDGSGSTRWNSANGETAGAWLMLDFGEELPISRVVLKEVYGRIRAYRLQAWDGAAWVDLVLGTTMGTSKTHTFADMRTSALRLVVDQTTRSDAQGTPTIAEFEVYE